MQSSQIVVSPNKIKLYSIYRYFNLFSYKRYHKSNILIPQTLIIQNGFIKEWIFNSGKLPNHPLLKKKKQNMSVFSAVKNFFNKFGFSNITHNCSTILQIHESFKNKKSNQPQQELKRNKKCLQITTIDDQLILMSVSQFLHSIIDISKQPHFQQKWKLIQQRVSSHKIEQYYIIDNVRNNHIIQSKCQKKIKVCKTLSPKKKNQQQQQQQKIQQKQQTYKSFDGALNKKFYSISSDLIQFIQKNYKCIVESVRTKFNINSQRQPFLVGIYDVQIKPLKQITLLKQYQLKRQRGCIKIVDYISLLQVVLKNNINQSQLNNEQKRRQKKKNDRNCRGRFCKISIKQNLPCPDNKYKIPNGQRIVKTQLRDALVKNQLHVLQTLKTKKLICYQAHSKDDSIYQSSQNQLCLQPKQRIVKLKSLMVKVCQNCFKLYYYVGRYFQLTDQYQLVEKKKPPKINGTPSSRKVTQLSEIEKQYSQFKKPKTQLPFDIKPVTNIQAQILGKTSLTNNKRSLTNNKSQPKFLAPLQNTTPLQKKKSSNQINQNQYQSQKKLPPSQSKIKLDPLSAIKKKQQKQQSINKTQLNLPSVNHLNLKQRIRPNKKTLIPLSQRRPQSYMQASQQLVKKLSNIQYTNIDQFKFLAKKYYKHNLPQPLDRRAYSTFYSLNLYEFMSISPLVIHPKRRIKKRPQMTLKRLSQLTDFPQIVSRSQFIFDTLIVSQQTTIPFCVITTKIVDPQNIKQNMDFQNIFIVNDIFDSFIQHISLAKQILQQQNCFNKRVILFNYPGQSHTIYNSEHIQAISVNFSNIMDKLLYRLSTQKAQLKIINFKKDNFKFCGFGYGGYLLATYLGNCHQYFSKITGIFLLNSFMQMPSKYEEMLKNLLILYSSDDPTASSESFFFYNKAINSSDIENDQLAQKSGVNPIRLCDRVYLIKSVLKQIQQSRTNISHIKPIQFQNLINSHVSVVHGKNNTIISRNSSHQFLTYRKNPKKQIPNRLFRQIQAGHDAFADNYDDTYQILCEFFSK